MFWMFFQESRHAHHHEVSSLFLCDECAYAQLLQSDYVFQRWHLRI